MRLAQAGLARVYCTYCLMDDTYLLANSVPGAQTMPDDLVKQLAKYGLFLGRIVKMKEAALSQ